MKYKEKLSWILDKETLSKSLNKEEEYKQNIDFVHSLGLKCDCVGWCSIDLSSPRTEEILDAIVKFCKENGWHGARGWYTREYTDTESEWYVIDAPQIKFPSDTVSVPANNGKMTEILKIKAYQDLSVSPKDSWETVLVPERFRNSCMRLGFDDVDFCWAEDKGKYKAEQYFHIYPHHAVSHMANDDWLHYRKTITGHFNIIDIGKGKPKRLQQLGGYLPRLSEIFYDLRVSLPNVYLADELPQTGFSSAYIEKTFSHRGSQNILIHRDTAAQLIRDKAISPSMLKPVPVVDRFPDGYKVFDVTLKQPPAKHICDELLDKYSKFILTDRPVREVSEKEALKTIRKAKKERKEEFAKALPKAKSPQVEESVYKALLPYYLVANGGYLSDEYRLLSFEDAPAEDAEFQQQLKMEELAEQKPDGIVFAKCPDGDNVILCTDGKVVRFSHEGPEILEEWPSLAQFVVDTVNESE